jgi:hypothetical protein
MATPGLRIPPLYGLLSSFFIHSYGVFSAIFVVFAANCAFLSCASAVTIPKTGISSSMERQYSNAYVSDFGAPSARC